MISTTKRLLIKEWIATPEDKLKELSPDDPVIETIFEFLENPDSDLELLKLIAKKLYQFYQCQDGGRLRLITLSFVPTLIAIYIRVAHNYYHLPKCEFNSLTVLLLCVYNFEIIDHSTASSYTSSNYQVNQLLVTTSSGGGAGNAGSNYSTTTSSGSQSSHSPNPPPPQLMPPPTTTQHRKSHSDNGINLIQGGSGCGGSAVSPGMMAASALSAGRLKTIDIRVVSLSKPSIYHERNSTAIQSVNPTDNTLTRINQSNQGGGDTKICIFGPYNEIEELVTSNYLSVFTVLLKVYNNHIVELGLCTLRALCHFYLRLFRQGQLASPVGGGGSSGDCGSKLANDIKEKIKEFLTTSDSDPELIQLPRDCVRVQFSSEFLVELTRSVHYCIYNDFEDVGMELMEEICAHSTYKLYGDVLLLINAMKNTISINNSRMAESEEFRLKQRSASMVAAELHHQQQQQQQKPLANQITTAISNISNIMIGNNKSHNTGSNGNISINNTQNNINNKTPNNNSIKSSASPLASNITDTSITSSGGGGSRPKMAITNASFKTKKLPDDIPIVIPSANSNSTTTPTPHSNLNNSKKSHTKASSKHSSNSSGNTVASKSSIAAAAQLAQFTKNLDAIDEEQSTRINNANIRSSTAASKQHSNNQKQPYHHHHSQLLQQNSKESSSNSSLASSTTSSTMVAPPTSQSSQTQTAQKQQPNNKKGVMYLLKEFKRTGNNNNNSKDSNSSSSMQNGGISIPVPILNNKSSTNAATSNDVDDQMMEEDLLDSAKNSLDLIPMKPLKKSFIDDVNEDGVDEVVNNNNGYNIIMDPNDNGGDDYFRPDVEDEDGVEDDGPMNSGNDIGTGTSNNSDQSVSSSKELLSSLSSSTVSNLDATNTMIVNLKKISNNSSSVTTTVTTTASSSSPSASSMTTMSPEKKAFLFSKL